MLNLSGITTVGYITNFNPKGSYPELGNKAIKAPSKPVKSIPVVEAPKLKKVDFYRLKNAKSSYKAAVGSSYKAKTIVKSSLS